MKLSDLKKLPTIEKVFFGILATAYAIAFIFMIVIACVNAFKN